MGSLCRRRKKSSWLKKNCGLCLLALFAAFAVGYPFLVFRLGESMRLNWFLRGCPFLFQALGLAVFIHKILTFLEINEMLVEISYYAMWAIMMLSVLLVYKGVKFGKTIVCLLLIWDIVLNLLGRHYVAVIIDVIILVLALQAKKKTGEDEPLS